MMLSNVDFAAPRVADHRDELAARDLERHVLEDAEGLARPSAGGNVLLT